MKTIEELKKLDIKHFIYDNGDYKYKTKYWHLIINNIDLLKGKKAINCFCYYGDYKYTTECHQFHTIQKVKVK